MSDFGVYENLEWGEDSVAARTAARRKTVATAIHMAKREFGAYLGNARSKQEWDDRLSQVIGDMSYLVEKHASFTDLDKVVAALRSEAEGRHFNPEPPAPGRATWNGDELASNPGEDPFWARVSPMGDGYGVSVDYSDPEEDTDWGDQGLDQDSVTGLPNEDAARNVAEEMAWDTDAPGGRHRANRRTADEGIEGFDDQELLDDWPLQDNPVDEAFDGDENDLETSNAPLSTGGSEGEQPDLTLTASALPMVPRIATPTFPVPNGNPAQVPMPEAEDPNQQRPLTPGAVDTLNQSPVPQRPTMAGRNLPYPVVPRVSPKG